MFTCIPIPRQGNPDVWEAFKGVVDAAMWDEVAEARIQFVDKLPSLVRTFGHTRSRKIVGFFTFDFQMP